MYFFFFSLYLVIFDGIFFYYQKLHYVGVQLTTNVVNGGRVCPHLGARGLVRSHVNHVERNKTLCGMEDGKTESPVGILCI